MKAKALTIAALLALGLIAARGLHASAQTDDQQIGYSDALATFNAALRAAGRNVAIQKAELLVKNAGADQATILIASDRTHLISSQFVENDPRREWSAPNTITYLVDQSQGAALSWATVPGGAVVVLPNSTTESEIDASMAVWGAMPCNGPAMAKVADPGTDPDWIDNLVAGVPVLTDAPFADVTHAGWLPAAFFDAIAQDGADFILGVTFTLIFIDDDGNPTDLDRDGRIDTAFREIYYNRAFPWGTGGNDANVDIQSVAIHEAGHALGLAHFGKVFISNAGKLQYAPKAMMNAVYVFEDRTIYGTDNASFCQAWARSH